MTTSLPKSWLRWFSVAVFMLLALCYVSFFSKSEAIPAKKELSTFPKTINTWKGAETFFDGQVYDVLGVDDSALINYRSPDGKSVGLYIGYYQSQREGDLIHSPKNCLPGSGWLITQTTVEPLTIPGEKARTIDVIKLLMEKDADRQVVLYWFQSRGRFIASEYLQKIYMVWDSLTKNRTDEAFVRLIAPVGSRGEEYTTEYLKEFAEQIIPILEEYLPGETA
jgi:EpsI family protein